MGPLDKLQQLTARCRCAVEVTINAHRNDFGHHPDAVARWFDDAWGWAEPECRPTMPDGALAQMAAAQTVVFIRFYPVTGVGFQHVLHSDLDAALDLALSLVDAPR
jgi:hypothetical protein